jgi:hypothetical protein
MTTWIWILLFVLLLGLASVAASLRGIPCILCDLFGPHKPEFAKLTQKLDFRIPDGPETA